MNMGSMQGAVPMASGAQANPVHMAAIQAALQSQISIAIKQQQSMVCASHQQ